MSSTVAQNQGLTKLEGRFSSFVLLALVFLLPILVVPGLNLAVDTGKRLVFIVFIAVVAIFWLRASFYRRTVVLPKSRIYLALLAVILTGWLSAVSSGDWFRSFIGSSYERDTVLILTFLFFAAVLAGVYLKTRERVLLLFLTLAGASGLTLVYQIVQTIFVNFFGLSFLPGGVFNLIGRFSEAGFFWGLTACLTLSLLGVLPWRGPKIVRFLLWFVFILSLLGVVVVNNWLIWVLIGAFSLVLLLHQFLFNRDFFNLKGNLTPGRRAVRWVFILLIAVGVILAIAGRPGGVISNKISILNGSVGLSVLEISPSWLGTWQVFTQTIKEKPIFGTGLNSFSEGWNRFKPIGVNETQFWNIDFPTGVGYIPTFGVTTGGVGILAWLAFFLLFLYSSFNLWQKDADEPQATFALIVFLAASYSWAVLFLYQPDTVFLALAFILTGISIALLSANDNSSNYIKTWLGEPKLTVVANLVLAFLLILSLVGAYFSISRFAANIFFARSLTASFAGDLPAVESNLRRTIFLADHDTFYQALTDLKLVQISSLLSEPNLDLDVGRSKFELLMTEAVNAAKQAITLSPKNYLNYLYLARVYEVLVSLNVPGAYDEAVVVYAKALELNPNNPGIFLAQARLEAITGNILKAKEKIDQALALKRNYTEAIFLLAQLESQSGGLKTAIVRSKEAVRISPNDPVVYFQLGFLNYQAGNWQLAYKALAEAIKLNPNYANARYFLGLAADNLGLAGEALNHFKLIEIANPDNQELKQIITNLTAGKQALTGTEPPPPEDREDLPVEDDNN